MNKELKIKNGKWKIIGKSLAIVFLFSIFNFQFLNFPAHAATETNTLLHSSQYNMMEPFLNETMRDKLRPEDAKFTTSSNQFMTRTAPSSSVMPVSNFVRPQTGTAKQARRVVARSASNSGVAAQTQVSAARAASTQAAQNNSRRVVARSASRADASNAAQRNSMVEVPVQQVRTTGEITSTQCLANYTECMDNYCRRPNTKYDRCYCSAKLAQLDAEYKPAIDDLTHRIVVMQSGGEIEDGMTQEEINVYWNNTFGGSTSIEDLDNALNIDWSGFESSVRGQNAFIAGDNFCRQNLIGCAAMAENLKSMYRTTIGQDCKKYENNLRNLKIAAEQILGSMQ